VRYESAAAFRMALEQRMKTEAERTGPNLTRLRKRVAFELFLRRLAQVAPDRWVLKGLGKTSTSGATTPRRPRSRTSPLRSDSASTTSSPSRACRTDAFDEVDEFQAIRFHLRAELADFLRSGFAGQPLAKPRTPQTRMGRP